MTENQAWQKRFGPWTPGGVTVSRTWHLEDVAKINTPWPWPWPWQQLKLIAKIVTSSMHDLRGMGYTFPILHAKTNMCLLMFTYGLRLARTASQALHANPTQVTHSWYKLTKSHHTKSIWHVPNLVTYWTPIPSNVQTHNKYTVTVTVTVTQLRLLSSSTALVVTNHGHGHGHGLFILATYYETHFSLQVSNTDKPDKLVY